ncbi:MAG: protein kinase domain-containing protein [Myxococcales bacterium]|jgi:WD40 repeat protein/tRNA A-37 threonylcarbamoyl transferase component Bud32
MLTPEGPSEKLLFALLAVELDFATAADVARAASGCRGTTVSELADRLVKASVLSADQRRAVERAMLKSAGAPFAESAAGLKGGRAKRLLDELDAEEASLPFELEGRYEVRGIHGRGGQARVLLAFDKQMQREVALKVLREPGGDEGTQLAWTKRSTPGSLRFLREARVTGQLEHPNIVPVYEVGRRTDGSLYYTMRLVRGRTLAKVLAECHGLQERLKRLGSFWDMCHAVAYAHSRGVVHRDIKPDNAMVGEYGETVLLDWGVAKLKGERDIRARDLHRVLEKMKASADETAFGTTVGTPSYMSPEQAKGLVDDIDDRSDVWGLGAVLYEVLTGRPPFVGPTASETLEKVIGEPLTPVREVCPEAPPELAAIAEKALSKEKEHRYQSARELAAEIESFMTGGRVNAYQYSSWELFKRFAAQNKIAMATAALLLVVIVVALFGVSVTLRRESQSLEREMTARKLESAARAKEHQERLTANYHLAQAYTEKADRLAEEQLFLSASIFSSASLLHNPAHPYSPFYSPTFARELAGSRNSRVAAASQIYRAGFSSIASLGRVLTTSDAVEQVAFSPDGALLAASAGNQVHLWDLTTRRQHAPLEGHTDRVYGVAFSPDGALIASSGRDRAIILWRAATGERLRTLQGHADTVQTIKFSPDGRRLLSGGWDKLIRVWDVESGSLLLTLPGHQERITEVAFSPDGQLLASAAYDRTVRLWTSAGAPLRVLQHADRATALAFSPDGKLLASACDDKKVHLWNPATGKPLAVMPGHKDSPTRLAFSPDGRLLASVSYDKTVRLWDVEERQALLNIAAHGDYSYAVAFSPDGASLATGGYDKKVKIWYLRRGKELVRLTGHSEVVYCLAFSPDGKRLASAGWDKDIRLWDFERKAPQRVLQGHTDVVNGALAFDPSGKLLASASSDKTARIWDAATGQALHALRGHSQVVYGAAFSPAGDRLATGSMDKTVRLWSVETGAELAVLQGHQDVIHAVAFSPDGRLIASASYDKTIKLWDASSGRELKTLEGHKDWVAGVDFSPDGTMLASAGKDGLAILWEVATGRELWRLHGHAQWINTAVFSPDGHLLATASDDTTVRVWSTSTLETLLIIPTSREAVGVAFSPDGKSLVIGDGTDVKVYPLDFSALTADPTKLLTDAEAHAGLRLEGFELKPPKP